MVASSLVSPDTGCSGIAWGLQAVCDDTAIPNSWCCSSGPCLWKQPRSYSATYVDSQLLAFPFCFRLLVRPMMTTKVVFLCGSTCAFPACAGTWPGVLRCCRVGQPEPSPDSVGCPVSVCRPKTV